MKIYIVLLGFFLGLVISPCLNVIQSQDFYQQLEKINSELSSATYSDNSFGSKTEYNYKFSLNSSGEIVITENSTSDGSQTIKEYFFSKGELGTSLLDIQSSKEYLSLKLTPTNSMNSDIYIRYSINNIGGENYTGKEFMVYMYFSNLSFDDLYNLKSDIKELFSLFLTLEVPIGIPTTNAYPPTPDPPNSPTKTNKVEYYNEEKRRVYGNEEASYYRKVTYDDYGVPEGNVVCYYITGEVYFRGKLYSSDGTNLDEDEYSGKCTWYFKNGNKRYECNYSYGQENGLKTYWFEEGGKFAEVDYKNGVLDGTLVIYHKSGKIDRKGEFVNGELVGNRYIECDELDLCQYVFEEAFLDNENDWPESNNESIYSSITDGMYYLKSSDGTSFIRTINYNINQSNAFIIEASIYFSKGTTDYGHGVVWGYKNSDNYFSFEISSDGYYTIKSVFDGLKLEIKEWTETSYIKQGQKWNRLQISKYGDDFYFSINGNIVHSEEYRQFRGTDVGIISRGKKAFYVDDFSIREYIDSEGGSKTDRYEGWTGSGTGVVISTDGYIVTNYHVVEDASVISIELYKNDFKFAYDAKLMVYDKEVDLAILKISDPDFIPYIYIPFTINLNQTDVGTRVYALGYPLSSVLGDEIRFNEGTISSSTGMQGDQSTYQVSVPIQPGNSGSPLFDYNGTLVGIESSKIMEADNIGYAIKSKYIKSLLNRLSNPPILSDYNSLKGSELTYQIKVLKEYVPIIKVR